MDVSPVRNRLGASRRQHALIDEERHAFRGIACETGLPGRASAIAGAVWQDAGDGSIRSYTVISEPRRTRARWRDRLFFKSAILTAITWLS
jgi:hypothetical protein